MINFTQAAAQVTQVERHLNDLQLSGVCTGDVANYGRNLISKFRDHVEADEAEQALFALYQIQAFGVATYAVEVTDVFTVALTLFEVPEETPARRAMH